MKSTNSDEAIYERVDELLARMTLAEKIGQMTQVETNSIDAADIAPLGIGSILSGGGGYPQDANTPEAWAKMVCGYIEASLQSRLGIPLIYGVDAVHGHNNMRGATIFPHNNGLGTAGDPQLVARIAQATASEMAATHIRWNFAPAVSIPQDIRWGRSYEGYGQETQTVVEMSTAYVNGLLGDDPTADTSILPSIKHFVADAATTWGSSMRLASFIGMDSDAEVDIAKLDATLANAKVGDDMRRLIENGAWQLDQGMSDIDEKTLRRVHLPPYQAAIDAGALNVMASYSSWGGKRMHNNKQLLTDVLKSELGFKGFVVTDWEGIDQVDPDFYTAVVRCINAGIDMNMVPYHYKRFIETLTQAVENGDVSIERIDDAVRRILYVKMVMGLFERPLTDTPLSVVGCDEHRALAREAVRKSLVLLKNDQVLPITDHVPDILVTGQAANDVGCQCGGWTIEWMGGPGAITPGTTILEGIEELAGEDTVIDYDVDGTKANPAYLGIVVLAEEPYAEGMGDRADLNLTAAQMDLVRATRKRCEKLLVILMSGRPIIVTECMELCDAFIAAWLPGTEGNGVSDMLFGKQEFTGRLTYRWPRDMTQIPLANMDGQEPLFEIGFGL